MKPDPGIETVRRAREEISEEAGHDPAKLIERYIEMQKRFAGRVQRGPNEDDKGAADDAAE